MAPMKRKSSAKSRATDKSRTVIKSRSIDKTRTIDKSRTTFASKVKHELLTTLKPSPSVSVKSNIPSGTVHTIIPENFMRELFSSPQALKAWLDITPLARNEFICFVSEAKLEVTRERRERRAREELEEGKLRPCCWPGCKHR